MYINRKQETFVEGIIREDIVLDNLLLTGKWGSGKSKTLKLIREGFATKKKPKLLIVDTWKYEGLTVDQMILQQILAEEVERANEKNEEKIDTDKLFSIIVNLSRAIAIEVPKEFFGQFTKETTGINFSTVGEKIVKRYKEGEINLDLLKKYYSSVYTTPIGQICEQYGYKYIVFDELDRTSPGTLFEVLKFYKYQKSKEKYVSYNCCMNKVEAISILKHIYGPAYSAEAYFEKLFTKEYTMDITKRELGNYFFTILKKENVIPKTVFRSDNDEFYEKNLLKKYI